MTTLDREEFLLLFINKLIDDIHNINPELSQERQNEFNNLLIEL